MLLNDYNVAIQFSETLPLVCQSIVIKNQSFEWSGKKNINDSKSKQATNEQRKKKSFEKNGDSQPTRSKVKPNKSDSLIKYILHAIYSLKISSWFL